MKPSLKRRVLLVMLLLAALVLGACSMVPKYERPALPVADAFAEQPGTAPPAPVRAAAEVDWRQLFTDESLRALVEQALATNRELRVAALDVDRARALFRIQGSEVLPAVGARATAERVRLPAKLTESGEAETQAQYAVDLGFVSWEVDLFGRLRSLEARALEQYLATAETHRAVRISLVAAVASAYLRLAADSENERLAEATVAAQEATLELIRASRDAGVASDLELSQAQSQVDAARASLAEFSGAVALDRNALELLVGAPLPAGFAPGGLRVLDESWELAAGLPSEVLLERPDIRAAEHVLRAANANVGAARAAFFPRIFLTAALGTLSPELAGLFGGGTRTWTFASQVDTPIFTGGLRAGSVKAAKVEREIAVAQYEKAIQAAFAEVNDALALRATLVEQRRAQGDLVASLEKTLILSEARYDAGLDGYLGVLVAQRSLYDAQKAEVGLRLVEKANLVSLYKALGGGA